MSIKVAKSVNILIFSLEKSHLLYVAFIEYLWFKINLERYWLSFKLVWIIDGCRTILIWLCKFCIFSEYIAEWMVHCKTKLYKQIICRVTTFYVMTSEDQVMFRFPQQFEVSFLAQIVRSSSRPLCCHKYELSKLI